jgi:translation initiation factor 4B
MKPDQPAAKSPITSREGSEAPSSPAVASAVPVSRPKLNLAKRTVSEAPDQSSPTAGAGDAKASPFGAARPIDTAAKEREIEEKRLAAIKEKKDAEDKAKEEQREAAKAAKAAETAQAAEAAEKQEGAEADAADAPQKAEGEDATDAEKTENQNGTAVGDKAADSKDVLRDAKPKPAETGAWRRSSGQGPPSAPRGGDDIPRGPRGGRGGRGGGVGRGRYHDEGRGGRQNSNGRPPAPTGPAGQAPAVEAEAAAPEEDGWSTVSKPKKSNRGGSQAPRPIAS